MPPLKRKLVVEKKLVTTRNKNEEIQQESQDSNSENEDWLSEVKDDDDSSDNDEDTEESDRENDVGPVFSDGEDDSTADRGFSGGNENTDEDSSELEDSEAEGEDDNEEGEDDEAENRDLDEDVKGGRLVLKKDSTEVQRKPSKPAWTVSDTNGSSEIHTMANKIKGVKIEVKKEPNLNVKELVWKDAGNQKTTQAVSQVPKSKLKPDEYAEDSSDEEDIRNTVGNIPMNWYDDYPHLGYNWDGKKILKPQSRDQLDEFLRKMENPNFWRTVKDSQTGQDVVLSDGDMDLIERMQRGKIPDKEFDEYAPWVDWFTSKVMTMPVRKFPEHKRSFLPSKSDKEKVSKLVHALKMGWIKTEAEKKKDRESKQHKFYMLWQSDEPEHMRRIHNHIPAPKRLLPGTAESYNPPPEYLFDKKEMKDWNKNKSTPWKRKLNFLPEKFNSLREVPSYSRFIRERFQRCLDLYLCPRGRKMKLTIEPEDLVPQLPSPKDLQPFPTVMSMKYSGHTDMIRTITTDVKGQFLASGSDDMTVRVWEVSTGRCLKTIPCGGVVRCISWCPNQALSLLLVAADRKVLLINPGVGDSLVVSKTDALLEEAPPQDVLVPERVKAVVQWEETSITSEQWLKGVRAVLNHFKEVKQVSWHGKGDYFATVMPDGQNRSVLIHQLSKRRSQVPFGKSKGLVQCVLFHPVRPYLFIATQRNVRIYDLVKQELVKKLLSNSRWISSMAIHPGGDNVLVGTYDRKMLWFDLDLSTKPYQTLRLHGTAVRGVAFHKRYPLFASGSDDGSLIVSHGMVYNDLLQNALIVPLKRHCNHVSDNDFGIFDVIFHPTQPWVFSCGADATILLYT